MLSFECWKKSWKKSLELYTVGYVALTDRDADRLSLKVNQFKGHISFVWFQYI